MNTVQHFKYEIQKMQGQFADLKNVSAYYVYIHICICLYYQQKNFSQNKEFLKLKIRRQDN